MLFRYCIFACLIHAVISIKKGTVEEVSWVTAAKYCLEGNRRLPSAKRAAKFTKPRRGSDVGKHYIWTAEYIMPISELKGLVNESSMCGYKMLSEANQENIVSHFGSCKEKRHYVTKGNLLSTNKIRCLDIGATADACKDYSEINCRPKSEAHSRDTTYCSNQIRLIFKGNQRISIPSEPMLCIALNYTEEIYTNCSDEVAFECIPHPKIDNTQTSNVTKNDPELLAVLSVCIGCLATLVVGVGVAFICHQRRVRLKGESQDNSVQQSEMDEQLDIHAEYDYITVEEICEEADYHGAPLDTIEMENIEPDNYVEPYDINMTMKIDKPSEQETDVMIYVAQTTKETGSGGVHVYNKLAIRPGNGDGTYDVTVVNPRTIKVINTTDNAYDKVLRPVLLNNLRTN